MQFNRGREGGQETAAIGWCTPNRNTEMNAVGNIPTGNASAPDNACVQFDGSNLLLPLEGIQPPFTRLILFLQKNATDWQNSPNHPAAS